jgi:hypothetical protein
LVLEVLNVVGTLISTLHVIAESMKKNEPFHIGYNSSSIPTSTCLLVGTNSCLLALRIFEFQDLSNR